MTFDPDAFLNQTVDQPLAIERTLVPEGEYQFMVDDFDSSAFEVIEFEYRKGPKAGQPGSMTKYNIPCICMSEDVKKSLDMDKVVVYYQGLLDFNDDGTLAWGKNKNVDLGRLRHALKQNNEGQVWKPSMLRGAGPFMGKVTHRPFQRKDGTKTVIAEISRLAPIT